MTYATVHYSKSLISDGSKFKDLLAGIRTQQSQAKLFSDQARDLLKRKLDEQQSDNQTRLLAAFDEIRSPLNYIETLAESNNKILATREHMDVLNWVSTASHAAKHADLYKRRVDNSGRWLMDSPNFQDWLLLESSGRLWLHGPPGSGKSTLSAVVTQSFFELADFHQDFYPAYYHCSRDAAIPGEMAPHILRAILRQLSSPYMSLELPEQVVKTFAVRDSPEGALNAENALHLIRQLVVERSVTVIILDGLDECDPNDRFELMDKLATLLVAPSVV